MPSNKPLSPDLKTNGNRWTSPVDISVWETDIRASILMTVRPAARASAMAWASWESGSEGGGLDGMVDRLSADVSVKRILKVVNGIDTVAEERPSDASMHMLHAASVSRCVRAFWPSPCHVRCRIANHRASCRKSPTLQSAPDWSVGVARPLFSCHRLNLPRLP